MMKKSWKPIPVLPCYQPSLMKKIFCLRPVAEAEPVACARYRSIREQETSCLRKKAFLHAKNRCESERRYGNCSGSRSFRH